jgi:hypothetical protein
VLLLLVAEAFVCGRVGRDWVAIRGMDIAAETIGIRPLPPKTARAPSRSTTALITLKLPLSHCIFRPMAISERFYGGR